MSSRSARLDFRRIADRAIAQRRQELSSHPAIGEAFKDATLVVNQANDKGESQQPCSLLRRRTSSDAVLQPQRPPKPPPDATDSLVVLYRDVDAETERFQRAVERYDLSDVPQHLKTSLINKTATPDEALQAARSVSDANYGVKGTRGSVMHKLGQFFKNNAPTICAWSDALPKQNEYFSVICAGLRLVFGAAARLKKIGEEICNAIEEIPSILERTSNLINMFEQRGLSRDSKLHEHNAAIMAGVISLLHHIVFELSKKQASRTIMCLLRQDQYGESLSTAVERLNASVQKFQVTADDYDKMVNMDTRAVARDSRNILVGVGEAITQHREQDHYYHVGTQRLITVNGIQQNDGLRALHADQQMQARRASLFQKEYASDRLWLESHFLEATKDRAELRAEVKAMSKEIQEARLRQIFPKFLESSERIDPYTGRAIESRDEESRLLWQKRWRDLEADRSAMINYACRALDFDHSVVEHDIRQRLLSAPHLDRTVEDRAVALMTDDKLIRWLHTADSAALCINANCDPQQCPTGFASANLAASIQSTSAGIEAPQSNLYCLPYFCDAHTHYRDRHAGPCGLMTEFIAQLLLTHRHFDLPLLREVEKVDIDDIESLCSTFELLVHDLDSEVVLFCIVDGLFAFESKKTFAEDTTVLIDCLVNLVQRYEERQVVVKLWFSSHTASRRLREWFEPSDVLILPDDVPTSGGFARLGNSYLGVSP